MKNFTFTLLFILSVCLSYTTTAQKRTIDFSPFQEISFGIPGKLYLRQGPQSVEIDCDDDIYEKIKFRISGNKLIIESNSSWGWNNIQKSDVTLYVSMENIEEINLSGSGEVIGEGEFETGDLSISISGSGNMNLNASANYITTTISGSGRINLEGNAEKMKARISGSGNVKADNFIVDIVDASISGSGDVYITAKEEITAHISGSGNVYYNGDPKRKDAHASGSGKIRKMN